jgi:hypothetical protein
MHLDFQSDKSCELRMLENCGSEQWEVEITKIIVIGETDEQVVAILKGSPSVLSTTTAARVLF